MSIKSFFSWRSLKFGSPWICLIVGIFAYVIGFFVLFPNTLVRELVIKVADILIIGVVVGFLTNAAQFLGVFKKDLQDIIYAKDFVNKRKDLPELWDSISKEMFKNKFSGIHKQFLQVMKGYFPTNEVSYYDDYNAHTTVSWVDKEKGLVKVENIIHFDLICDSKERFTYPMKSWIHAGEECTPISKISDIQVNGKSFEMTDSKPELDKKTGKLCQEFNVSLCGDTCYSITYKREEQYNIHDDYYLAFRSLYILNGMKVCLDLPEDINATFIERGTQHDFDTVNNSKNRIEMKYKGIVLPRQGYIFALQTI